MKTRWLNIALLAVVLSVGCNGHNGGSLATTPATVEEVWTALPNADGSLKFVVLGDWGTGYRGQYNLATQMATFRDKFKFDSVITVGDNLYGMQRPQDYKPKFETPYRPLLADGVKFYASLGNHDSRQQVNYKLFNMGGNFYYTLHFQGQPVRFFMLDTTYLSPEQLDWLKKELEKSDEDWKIAVFHHPLYSSGKTHGSDLKLREALEGLFVEYNVSVVFQGHDHFYERIKPQRGIVYFVAGSGGKLRAGDIRTNTGLTDKGFDTGHSFLAVEIAEDKMYFNAIANDGRIIDSGIIERRMQKESSAGAIR
ncbi:MAG: metallophosphoesterase [Acidobacteria bacterium]|nr:MAG: metallophosphoesterase [Acidobacteriota bacterium]